MSQNLKVTTKDADWHPKYFGVIVGLFCGLYMLAQAVAPKIVTVGPFLVTASIITFPICCIITDLLTEVYGFNRTRQAIWTALVCTVLFAVGTSLAVMLPYPDFWEDQAAYETVFHLAPRIAIAGSLAWLAGEFLNSFIMSRMKISQNARNMSFRFIGSTIVGQFADSFIFVSVAFAGTMPWKSFFLVIFTGWLFKVLYEIIALPLSLWTTKTIKRMEGVEHFDKQEITLV